MKNLLLVLSFTFTLFTTSTFGQRTILIESTDQMKFNKSEIVVKSGETITLVLKHTGKLPVQAMGHNLVILQRGTDIPTFARTAMNAKTTNYVPVNSPQVIASTKVIGGGQTTSITFNVPAKGIYDFICSFPGHFSMMKGKFIVE